MLKIGVRGYGIAETTGRTGKRNAHKMAQVLGASRKQIIAL